MKNYDLQRSTAELAPADELHDALALTVNEHSVKDVPLTSEFSIAHRIVPIGP